MRLRALLAVSIAATAAFVSMGVFSWEYRVRVEVADTYSARLRMLLETNHRLAGEVMRTRSGIVNHYDGLARTASLLERLHRELRDVPAFLTSAGRAEVLAAIEESDRDRKATSEDLERFKREYAVLRNSLRFLPVVAQTLDAHRDKSGEETGPAVESLVRDVLLVQLWHDDQVLARVGRTLDDFQTRETQGGGVPADLEQVLVHARIVRDRSAVIDHLTRSLVQGPGAQQADRLITTYGQHYQAALDRSGMHRAVLFGLALVFLGSAAAYVILRLRRSADELAKTSRQLEKAMGELRVEQEKQKELNDLKTRFVAMTSHEFRTPLSVMLSSAEMLSAYGERWPAEKRESHLERIRLGATSMTKMLDAILLIGKGDAGMLEFRPSTIDVARLCEAVVEGTTQSTGQAHRIQRSIPPDPETIVADESLLRHILENLLSNALKYSPGEKPVHFEVVRKGDNLRFDIRDEGIGIPEEDQKRLFDTFHRGGNVGKIAGTGLGLSIVKRAVERHGGTVSVDSTVGVGTTCTVEIPCPRSATA